ncbi:hypothetical protein E4U32_005671 [Claviceps aff. humidiphila group G2b]|nr:hypothetical protein E4U32_005671 [Claviceps aff. humidiphila group G2b]
MKAASFPARSTSTLDAGDVHVCQICLKQFNRRCVYDLEPRIKVPLNPAYMGTTTTFSGSMDVFSAQSQHQPNMSNNNNYPFFDEQPHQIAAETTPEMDFSFMPPTTPAAAHIMMDESPLSGDFTTGTNNSPSNHNRGRFYVKWKKRRSLSPGGGTQASHSLQWSTPTASFLASSNLVDPALKDDTAVDWAANSIADAFFGPHSMPLLPGLDKSFSHQDIQSFSHQDMPLQDIRSMPLSFQDIQSILLQGVQPMPHQDMQPPNQDGHRQSISYQVLQSMSHQVQSMPHQDIEPLPKREIDSLPKQDERRRSISYEELQSMSPQAIQAMSNQDMQSISLQAIQSMSHQDTATAY